MADEKISELGALSGYALQDADQIPALDVSDTSMAASGTDKRVDVGTFRGRMLRQEVKTDTNTSYTIVDGDQYKRIRHNNASAITVTLPQDSALAAYAIGDWSEHIQIGAGAVSFVAGAGATVLPASGLATTAQYKRAVIEKDAANTWLVSGEVA